MTEADGRGATICLLDLKIAEIDLGLHTWFCLKLDVGEPGLLLLDACHMEFDDFMAASEAKVKVITGNFSTDSTLFTTTFGTFYRDQRQTTQFHLLPTVRFLKIINFQWPVGHISVPCRDHKKAMLITYYLFQPRSFMDQKLF